MMYVHYEQAVEAMTKGLSPGVHCRFIPPPWWI